MDENWGYPHFRNPPHGFVWKCSAKRLGGLERRVIQSRSESSWESNRSDVILQANSPTWRKARYSVDSQHTHTHTFAWHIHRRNVFASDSWIWVTIAMSMLPVKFAASYAMWLVLHSQSLSYIHMIHIFLHKPFWNVITGRPQLPAEKNLSFRSPGWNS